MFASTSVKVLSQNPKTGIQVLTHKTRHAHTHTENHTHIKKKSLKMAAVSVLPFLDGGAKDEVRIGRV
jgi:hypothetical protein